MAAVSGYILALDIRPLNTVSHPVPAVGAKQMWQVQMAPSKGAGASEVSARQRCGAEGFLCAGELQPLLEDKATAPCGRELNQGQTSLHVACPWQKCSLYPQV